MSEKNEARKKKAAAVLKVKPSPGVIAWAKGCHGDDWRTTLEDKLEDALNCLAAGGAEVYLTSELLSGLDAEEVERVVTEAELAAGKLADEVRKQKRLDALATYSPDELRAVLERITPQEVRARIAEKPGEGEGEAVADTCDDCGQRHEPGEDEECDDEADEADAKAGS